MLSNGGEIGDIWNYLTNSKRRSQNICQSRCLFQRDNYQFLQTAQYGTLPEKKHEFHMSNILILQQQQCVQHFSIKSLTAIQQQKQERRTQ